jgi:hypothetical protein
VIGILYAQPKDLAGWQKAHHRVFKRLKRASSYFTSRAVARHRRGIFPSIAHGISFGGGQQVRKSSLFQPV